MITVFTAADSWDFSEKNKNKKIGGEFSKYSCYEIIVKYLNFKIFNFSIPKLYSSNLGLICHLEGLFQLFIIFIVIFKPSAADS